MHYVITGQYPEYTVTGTTADGNEVYHDEVTTFASIMLSMVHKFNPGDTLVWEGVTINDA